MEELIKITVDYDKKTVSARDLHEFLGVKKHFTDWMKDQFERGLFIENIDYEAIHLKVTAGSGHTVRVDYALTLDMAKELSMLSFTEKGKIARRYFIESEKELIKLKTGKATKALTDWDIKRMVVKTNYKLQTDAIKENLIPILEIPKEREGFIYSSEAEMLNYAVFGITSKEWKKKNPELAEGNKNMRDYADMYQLIVLANMESFNSILINKSIPKEQRMQQLVSAAHKELSVFYKQLA